MEIEMKEIKKGKQFVYNYLIKKELVDFSAMELICSLQKQEEFAMQGQNKTYQYVYRHLCRLEKEGYLISYRQNRYKRFIRQNNKNGLYERLDKVPLLILQDERKQAKNKLATVLAEVDEYKSLSMRFPEQKQLFQSLSIQAHLDSASLIGKINALSKTLSVSGVERLV